MDTDDDAANISSVLGRSKAFMMFCGYFKDLKTTQIWEVESDRPGVWLWHKIMCPGAFRGLLDRWGKTEINMDTSLQTPLKPNPRTSGSGPQWPYNAVSVCGLKDCLTSTCWNVTTEISCFLSMSLQYVSLKLVTWHNGRQKENTDWSPLKHENLHKYII